MAWQQQEKWLVARFVPAMIGSNGSPTKGRQEGRRTLRKKMNRGMADGLTHGLTPELGQTRKRRERAHTRRHTVAHIGAWRAGLALRARWRAGTPSTPEMEFRIVFPKTCWMGESSMAQWNDVHDDNLDSGKFEGPPLSRHVFSASLGSNREVAHGSPGGGTFSSLLRRSGRLP